MLISIYKSFNFYKIYNIPMYIIVVGTYAMNKLLLLA